jgi:hypothetical protein
MSLTLILETSIKSRLLQNFQAEPNLADTVKNQSPA